MELLLEVKVYRVNDTPYYRLLLPKKLSNRLGLKKGDKLHLEIKGVKRQASLTPQEDQNEEG